MNILKKKKLKNKSTMRKNLKSKQKLIRDTKRKRINCLNFPLISEGPISIKTNELGPSLSLSTMAVSSPLPHSLSKSLPLIFHHILTTGPFCVHFQVENSTSLLQVDFKCSYNIPATYLQSSRNH